MCNWFKRLKKCIVNYYEYYFSYLDRMKDYEREKRLLTRRYQLRQKSAPNAEEGTIGA